MKPMLTVMLAALALSGGGFAQVVVPATPKKFVPRPIDRGGSPVGGVDVIPKDGAKDQKARYTTHIVLSTSRLWSSTDGKLLEGKLIAFEDLVVEAAKGATPPPAPEPPKYPTVVRGDKVRLLVKQKPVEVPLSRLTPGDQEFIEQVRKSYSAKPPATP